MNKLRIQRPILGGFVATLAMTMLMYAAPLMGMPKMDVAAMLGSMLGGSWWLGLTMHFINGTILFSLIYSYLFYPAVCARPWQKGTLWGLTLWFLAQVMVMPMMGSGFFSAQTASPVKSVMGSLLGHLLYGVILGAIVTTGSEAATACVREARTPDSGVPAPS